MASWKISQLDDLYPGKSQQEAIEIIARDGYHVAIRYTNQFTYSNEPTDIGFAQSYDEVIGYLSQKNPVVVFYDDLGHKIIQQIQAE